MKQLIYPLIIFLGLYVPVWGSSLLIPMDSEQTDHLKAYGYIYQVLSDGKSTANWLINYRGGSFLIEHSPVHQQNLIVKGIRAIALSELEVSVLRKQIDSQNSNMEWAELTKVAKIALYSPKSASPWDDAVSLALTYAEIPFNTIYDEEILSGELKNTIGSIYIMKILQGKWEKCLPSANSHGIKSKSEKMKTWLKNMDLQK